MLHRRNIWIETFRLRTLPLAVSSTILGSCLALFDGKFKWSVLVLSSLTAVFLQVLSNLANDLGDGMKGSDSASRIGPQRATSSGLISRKEMKMAVILAAILSLVSGIALIIVGTAGSGTLQPVIFFLLGLGAILSAFKYTVGQKPYGYIGLGDLFVFIWFGLVGVMGTYYLHVHRLNPQVLLPAASLGLLSVGVLNINNMRDRLSDKESGKITLVVRIGEKNAKRYQVYLVVLAMFLAGTFVFLNYNNVMQLLFLVTTPAFFVHALLIMKVTEPRQFDPFLKKFAISTLLFSLSLSLGFLLSMYV